MKEVIVIGAGLAGCEAAYQLAKRNIKVKLYEMKPTKKSPAHKSDFFAELVCSNSLRSDDVFNAVGLLKNEMRLLDSLIMKFADANKVKAGSALAVDRENFSKQITDFLSSHPNIEIINEEKKEIDLDKPTIICAGPLCSEELSLSISKLVEKDYLYFYDAVAPIVSKDSIDFTNAYYKSRYDKGDDYINCPLTKEEFQVFYNELVNAKTAEIKNFEKEIYFQGCMPFEQMAKQGFKTLLFGPMKPVGLEHNGLKPYAVVQLRQDNAVSSLYNIVGFQTHLTFPEQKRILQLIPALKNVEIVRYGVMHRNTYINSPKILNRFYQMNKYKNIFIAGQITGVEGYVESAASGLYAATCLYQFLTKKEIVPLDKETMTASMAMYISNESIEKLMPMNANYGIFNFDNVVSKNNKKEYCLTKSTEGIKKYLEVLSE